MTRGARFLGDNPLQAFAKSEWIGFGNFQALFEDSAFWDAVRNTLTITLFQLVFFFPLPIALAVVVVTVIPALIVYPFVQRYFTKGVLTGAVKG